MIHLQSLWNLLSLQRVLLLTEHGQDSFSQLDAQYKQSIEFIKTPADHDRICAYNRLTNLTNLFHLLNILYRLITFKLIGAGDTEPLSLELKIEDVIYTLIEDDLIYKDLQDKLDLSAFDLSEVLLKNVFHLWKVVAAIYFEIKRK